MILAILPITGQAQLDTLTILHVSDTKFNLAPAGPGTPDLFGTQGGITIATTILSLTKITEPNVLFFTQGTYLLVIFSSTNILARQNFNLFYKMDLHVIFNKIIVD